MRPKKHTDSTDQDSYLDPQHWSSVLACSLEPGLCSFFWNRAEKKSALSYPNYPCVELESVISVQKFYTLLKLCTIHVIVTEVPYFIWQAQKIGFMENVPSFLKKCFKPQPWPPVLEQYLEYVKALEFHTDPDYSKLR
jgi:hypothetical protein